MKKRAAIVLLVIAITLLATSAVLSNAGREDLSALLIRKIPPRAADSPSGSEFTRAISSLDTEGRERAIRRELAAGNVPDFLRALKPIHLGGTVGGRKIELTLFAMPDYLAIGSNDDFLLIPMTLPTALEAALNYGFVLPTRKIVDAIYNQSAFHLKPQPLPAGPQMRSTAFYQRHNAQIAKQRRDLFYPPGELTAGHKKDIVMTKRLVQRVGKIAIYGWHTLAGSPIQPLTTVHGATYADYSHGVRLIGETALLNGEPRSVYEILENRELAPLLSDEGPVAAVRDLMARDCPPSLQTAVTLARRPTR